MKIESLYVQLCPDCKQPLVQLRDEKVSTWLALYQQQLDDPGHPSRVAVCDNCGAGIAVSPKLVLVLHVDPAPEQEQEDVQEPHAGRPKLTVLDGGLKVTKKEMS